MDKSIITSENDSTAGAELIRSNYNYRWYLTLEEVGAMVHLSKREVSRLVDAGEIPAPVKPFNKKTPLWPKHQFFTFLRDRGLME